MSKKEKIMNDYISLQLKDAEECLFLNPKVHQNHLSGQNDYSIKDVHEAEQRLQRFAPLLAGLFPELKKMKGIIESDIIAVPEFCRYLQKEFSIEPLRLFIKADHVLPVSGSIKARGGLYAVMCAAEEIALKNNLINNIDDDYGKLRSKQARTVFSKYMISVGSTGNLGLSIGIMGQALGFRVTVHMSSDAKMWKKIKLRGLGVKVIEYEDDYLVASANARKEAENDPANIFIDDENSVDLFMGYSVAALRLQEQLKGMNISVTESTPLFVYLPCGVGGAPGGITFGLKEIFKNNVYCFFAEPVQAPCMTLGILTGKHSDISVYDIGLTGVTDADGLAVARASKFVGHIMEKILDGCYTVKDERLYKFLYFLKKYENIKVEPSATAGCYGPVVLSKNRQHNIYKKIQKGVHLIWTTGGSMVPQEDYEVFLKKAESIIHNNGKMLLLK